MEVDVATTVELIRAARAGDEAAWSRLDDKLRGVLREAVHGQVPRAMRGQLDTEIVLQSTLTAAYLAIERDEYEYKGRGSLTAWLKVIFVNKLRSRIRNLRSQKRNIDLEVGSGLEACEAPAETPAEQVARAEDYARLMLALTELPIDQARILMECFCDKRSTASIARSHGLSEKAVRKRMAQALQSLRSRIDPE